MKYKTSDLMFAAFLLLEKYAFLGCEGSVEYEKKLFVFEDPDDGSMDELRGKFLAAQIKVEPMAYQSAIKNLKTEAMR